MYQITPEVISEIWPVPLPLTIRPTNQGTNNRSYTVHGVDASWFLKVYDNEQALEERIFESRITAAIAAQHPPFAVPESIVSRSGETHFRLDGRCYGMSTFVPGSASRFGDRDDAAACGRALAELHVALASADIDPQTADYRMFGSLETVHPLVPEPERAVLEEVRDPHLAQAAASLLSSGKAGWSAVTAGWPLTWIHGDYFPSNVLQQDHRVTGIVDFEISGAGYRARDVANGVYAFGFGHPDVWSLIERFARGYLSRLDLAPEEIDAMPALILMGEATSLTHWTGRSRQGLPDRLGIERRAQRLVDVAGFLDRNGAELVPMLHQIRSRLQ